ncbi:MAG: exosortase-associated EpsI family protein [Phycisphaerae bacterium]|nr:exosortase-associated EpsI family protein [Phycisphaerae bacterium]
MSSRTDTRERYLQPAFLICTAVLALAGAGMSVARQKLGLYLRKEPLPLRKSLDALEEAALAPYTVVAKLKIQNEDVVRSLGTEDYIQWVLEDPCQPSQNPTRRVMLFVTYYRLPDRVPHVPEECYTGGGYRRLDTEPVAFRIGSPDDPRDIPGRYLVFESSGGAPLSGAPRFPVLYLFRVSGEYAGSRDAARMALNRNIFSRQAYFCKVELVFNQAFTAPTRAMAVSAGERLLTVVLPLLERDHWPDGIQP